MGDHSQVMDSVIATPRASSNGSIFWVTPTQFNPQTGTYQTHYYSDDLVKSGTVSVGTPTWKNNSMVPHNMSKSYGGVNKSVAAPILIPPPVQSRNVSNYDEPVVRIPEGIKELEYEEDDDDQSVVDIKQLNKSCEYDSENGDNSNRAKNVVDAVVALGRVLVKDLQRAVPNISQGGSKIFDNCLAGSNNLLDNELTFSPRNILRDTLKDNANNVRPHLLPNGLTLQELPKSSNQNVNSNIINLSSSTLLCSDLFFDQNKYPRLTLVSYDSSNLKTNGLQFENETIKRLNTDFSDLPLCIISLIDCKDGLFSKLLLTPDLEYSPNLNSYLNSNNLNSQKRISLVDLYYWYKDEEFIYLLLDVKASIIPKLHDILILFVNSISSCVIMNNTGIINQESLNKLSLIGELQKQFERRQDEIITKLLKINKNEEGDANNGYNTPKRRGESLNSVNNKNDDNIDSKYSAQGNPLLLLTPRYKPILDSESKNNRQSMNSEDNDVVINKNVGSIKNTTRNLLCTLRTTPRPYFIWMLHDFNYILYDKTNNMIWNSIDYFETLLNELGCGYDADKTRISYYENLKLYIRSYYAMKECHTLVSPYNESDKNNGNMLRIDHLKQISCFRQRLLGISKNHALSYKIGQYNSSSSIKRFISIYVSVLENMASNNISEISEVVQKRFCDRILDDIGDYYVSEHAKLIDMLPMSESLLKERIVETKTKCMYLYKEYTSKYIDTDIYIDYKIKLQNYLQKREDETLAENSRISVKYCKTYLKEISDKTILSKFNCKSNGVVKSRSDIGLSDFNDDKRNKTPYLIFDLEKDLEELHNTMLTSLSDKVPKEVSLNCFLELANRLRNEWYSLNKIKDDSKVSTDLLKGRISVENCFGGNSISGGVSSIRLSHNMDNEFLRRMETPEMLVNRLSNNLDEIDSDYNCYTIMQKKELLEDILLEALKKKDRLGDFYDENKLCELDSLITTVQDKLDVVNTERKSMLDNDEMQRQVILRQKRKNWRRIFSCFKRDNELENMRFNNDNGVHMDDYNAVHSVNNHNDMY
ncbi:hypothetical protein FG379_002764 [Cryptosporidium bovis]|uniref:uncharacterized protein n=1 Tax=Cryptosporidium bovis TaxID=310047 RepID=UPI00351A2372|nr:hypothetical protein FG379_002764 [Cryptosporidium bovis]